MEKLKENPTLIEFQKLERFFFQASSADFNTFYIFEGAYLVVNFLEIAEISSRNTKNYAKNIEILKIIQLLIKNSEEGLRKFLQVPRYA